MGTTLFVSLVSDRIWAALLEQGRAVELRVEPRGHRPRVGRIVKAKVTRVVPAIQAAFVDVGGERDAFLHASDLPTPGGPSRPIQECLAPGDELLVQIDRESQGVKGDRVTRAVSLPGRLLVLLPGVSQVGVSRRIAPEEERRRLQELLGELGGGRCGLVARTAAKGAPRAALEAEVARLMTQWQEIVSRAATALAPAAIHDEPPLPTRLLRDAPAEGYERIVFDDAEEHARARAFLARVDPAAASRVELYHGSERMFSAHGLAEEIDRALRPRVWLRSGGYLVIEPTEALVSIDVNSGKSVSGSSQDETSLVTNLEAAAEVARQLRLRDLGGIVVVDFIDMELAEHRQQLLEAMEQALSTDPARTKIVGLSEIGLLQLTRKRTRGGLYAALTHACLSCAGQGRILDADVVAALARPRAQS